MDTNEIMKRNALQDVEEIASKHEGGLTDEIVAQYIKDGETSLVMAAGYVLETYSGRNSFMKSVKQRVESGGNLSARQIRAVLNVHLGVDNRKKYTGTGGSTGTGDTCTPPHQRKYNCFVCKKEIVGLDTIREHGRLHKEGVLDNEGNEVAETSVLEVTTSELNLDLSVLPNGRYAAPELTGRNDMIFLMVTRTKKDKIRTRRYRFGMYQTGRERVPAGTIEVKEWSSDQKRLCGQQKPGEVYQGEYEEQFSQILQNPEVYAKLFGLLVGHCYRCGKTLTDEESRAYGIGPECQKMTNLFHTHS